MKREEVFPVAMWFVDEIRETCEQVVIAGSLRRCKAEVNDIDVVVIPKMQSYPVTFFGEEAQDSLLDRRLVELCVDGKLKLEANGEKIKRFIETAHNIQVDVYIATPETWWTLVLIRTGSKEHNITLAQRARHFYMQLKADGSGLLSPSGTLLRLENEEAVFRHLHMPYKKPEER